MSRRISISVLRGVKTSLFLLAVIGVSTFLSLSSSRPAQAESLLYGLRCTVGGLLGRTCEPTPEPPVAPTPAPSGGTDNTEKPASGGTTAPTNPGTTSQPVVSPQPIEFEEGHLGKMSGVASVTPVASGYTFPSHVATLAHSGDNSDVLGRSAVGPIEASQDGWRILGVSWVWWLTLIFLLSSGAYAIVRLVGPRKLSGVAKSWK